MKHMVVPSVSAAWAGEMTGCTGMLMKSATQVFFLSHTWKVNTDSHKLVLATDQDNQDNSFFFFLIIVKHLMFLAGFVMLWSIPLHFPLRICAAIGSWSAALHRSSLLIFSGHWIQRIFPRQQLMIVWSLWSVRRDKHPQSSPKRKSLTQEYLQTHYPRLLDLCTLTVLLRMHFGMEG